MRAADVLDGGEVVNVIVVDPMPGPVEQAQWREWGMIQGDLYEAPDDIGPGASYDRNSDTWAAAPPPDDPDIQPEPEPEEAPDAAAD
jgi:hypothetical protein